MAVWKIEIEGESFEVDVQSLEAGFAKVVVNGQNYDVGWEEPEGAAPVVIPVASAAAAPALVTSRRAPAAAGTVASPLPGMVLDILVAPGDTVEQGQVVVKIEAMKMANEVRCGQAGTVAEVMVRKGDSVDEGAPLLRIG